MDYQSELYYNPLFNYFQYFEQGLFTDCEITFPNTNQPSIKAHSIILSNSSNHFKSLLIAGNARTFQVFINPLIAQLFKKVVEFMYTGCLEYSSSDVMPLYYLARQYEIPSLKERMECYLYTKVNHDNIFFFTDQCYRYRLRDELIYLVPLYIRLFGLLETRNMTENLDIPTYCRILEGLQVNEYPIERQADELNRFIGDYRFDDIDRAACRHWKEITITKEVQLNGNRRLQTIRNYFETMNYPWL